MNWLTAALFALGLNLDSFGAGMSYGARDVTLPGSSMILISLISGASIMVSIQLGQHLLGGHLSLELLRRLGGLLLLALGVRIFCQESKKHKKWSISKLLPLQKDRLRLYLSYWRTLFKLLPMMRLKRQSDNINHPGNISLVETLILGAALAMDAFTAGLAVPMLGLNSLFIILAVSAGQLVLILTGSLAGKRFGLWNSNYHLSILPGYILLVLGISKLI